MRSSLMSATTLHRRASSSAGATARTANNQRNIDNAKNITKKKKGERDERCQLKKRERGGQTLICDFDGVVICGGLDVAVEGCEEIFEGRRRLRRRRRGFRLRSHFGKRRRCAQQFACSMISVWSPRTSCGAFKVQSGL